jgi:acyl-coenzyme A synthetase/AMP-(fatty) acid ligase
VNFIEDVLERFPASKPALVAISRDGERRVWHFGELVARSAGLSGALVARGVGRGEVVMTLVGNRIEWVLTMLACWRMGAVALPCSTQLRRRDLEHRIAAASPVVVVAEDDCLAELPDGAPAMDMEEFAAVMDEERPQEAPAEPADLGPDDPALIVFTSGTTGEPRGVVHGQRYLGGQALQAEHWLGAQAGDLAWCTTASGWSKSARNVFVAPWLRGATALIQDTRFDSDERLEVAEREHVTILCQSPTEYRLLASGDIRPLPKLRRAVSAGEHLEPGLVEDWRERTGLAIADGYGQTETGQLTGTLVGEDVRPGSMGRALPGIELRVARGELEVRAKTCPTFFSRYLDGAPFEAEWWPTGDWVREDADGWLWHEGRGDDLILSSGYRIGPQEVEAALLSHPAVAEAAAVAAPDSERGSVVRAIVVLANGEPGPEMARELQDHVKSATAPYKFPRIVEFAEALPRTSSGKIKRSALREPG